MLHRNGIVDLTQELTADEPKRAEVPQHLRNAGLAHATVILNDAVTVHFDMHDAQDIDLQDLDSCDFYFKRSFSKSYVSDLSRGAEKVLPFGLNYHVLPNFVDDFSVRRALHLWRGQKERLLAMAEALDAGNRFKFYPRVRELESLPAYALPPQVLFLVTAHDPHDNLDRSAEKIEERMHCNETRAQCIRLLRKELGRTFLGGFSHSKYAVTHYKDCLVADNSVTEKKNYIRNLKSHSICIATTGLHGSIGWKFAEYVACSRAILSERLVYDAPGGLKPVQNYLEFSGAAECAEQAFKLIGDRELRNEMMAANSLYYRTHLRPDVLVLNSLQTVLSLLRTPELGG